MLQMCLFRHCVCFSHTIGIQCLEFLFGQCQEHLSLPPFPICGALMKPQVMPRCRMANEPDWHSRPRGREAQETLKHADPNSHILNVCTLCMFFDTNVTVLPGLVVDPIIFSVYSS